MTKFINSSMGSETIMEALGDYCQICGSIELMDSLEKYGRRATGKKTNEFDIRPANLAGLKFGSEKEWERDRESEVHSKVCIRCLNLNPRTISTNSRVPMYFITLYYEKLELVCIIPHALRVQLLTNKYYEADTHDLLKEKKDELKAVYSEWSLTNHHPCKGNKLGYQIALKIGGIQATCWVMVDLEEDRYVLRLCHGGGDTCQ
jgi:hypothetical protein